MSESTDQIALFEWAAYCSARLPDLQWLYHTPSGEKRDKAVAAKLKAMGTKPGVPDLLLPVLRYDALRNVLYHGFVGELKAPGGKPTQDQIRWLAHYQQQGWQTGIYIGWEAAARAICLYLGGDPRELGL